MYKKSAGPQPVKTTIASITAGVGQTSFTISSTTGLPTVVAGELAVMRIAGATGSGETLNYTRSGTTITCPATAFSHAAGDVVEFDILTGDAIDAIKGDAFSGYPENVMTGAATLVLGGGVANRIVLTAANATFPIPDGSYFGQLLIVKIDRTSTKKVTLDPAGSTTMDGALKRVMWAGETGYWAWTGAEWNRVAGVSIPMLCRLGLSANQSIADSTEVKIALDRVDLDNTGLMATGSAQATIQRTAKYQAVGKCRWSGIGTSASGGRFITLVHTTDLVGTTIASSEQQAAAAGFSGAPTASELVALNEGDIVLLSALQLYSSTALSVQGGVGNGGCSLWLAEQVNS